MSLAVDASAVVALHFADERRPFAEMFDEAANLAGEHPVAVRAGSTEFGGAF